MAWRSASRSVGAGGDAAVVLGVSAGGKSAGKRVEAIPVSVKKRKSNFLNGRGHLPLNDVKFSRRMVCDTR